MVHITRRIESDRATPSDPGFDPLARRQQQFSNWSPRSVDSHEEQVEVYSNCEEVELILNGKSLGSKPLPADASPRVWKVSFVPGALKATGRNKGKSVANHELRTAGKPAKILLVADCDKLTFDWDDVRHVQVSVVDDRGILVPDAAHLISFKISGPGCIVAVDNGDNSSHESFQATSRHAYQGRCLAIVKATGNSGKITLTASAPELTPASVQIKVLSRLGWSSGFSPLASSPPLERYPHSPEHSKKPGPAKAGTPYD
jgi:beta-galactosidase